MGGKLSCNVEVSNVLDFEVERQCVTSDDGCFVDFQVGNNEVSKGVFANGEGLVFAVKNGDWGNVFVVGEVPTVEPIVQPTSPAGDIWPVGDWGVEVSHNQDPALFDWDLAIANGMNYR